MSSDEANYDEANYDYFDLPAEQDPFRMLTDKRAEGWFLSSKFDLELVLKGEQWIHMIRYYLERRHAPYAT